MKKTRKEKGITLIALIITIIVLLILAVVAIGAVQGDGIIEYAKNAKTEYEAAEANEAATIEEYLTYMNTATKNGGGETGAFATITASNYGDTITYTAGGVSDWKVFYKDSENLYIIASDYLANANRPTTGLNMSTYGDYGLYWSSTSNFTASKASDSITTAIANKYNLSWFSDTTKDSTNENARATADLLNVAAWTAKFGDTSKGIEAIGGPTLEMWIASWNASGHTPLYTNSNTTGYFVGTAANPSSYYVDLSSDTEGFGDSLYFPHPYGNDDGWSDDNECYGYWLASPSAGGSYYVMCVGCSGAVYGSDYSSYYFAVRPLVSVPSSLVTTNADGSLKVAQ